MREHLTAAPETYDPEAETVENHRDFLRLIKDKRLSKPTRLLTTIRPKSEEARSLFPLVEDVHLVEIQAKAVWEYATGEETTLVLCPLSETPLITTIEGERGRQKIEISNAKQDTYAESLIPKLTKIGVENPALIPIPFLVLTSWPHGIFEARNDVGFDWQPLYMKVSRPRVEYDSISIVSLKPRLPQFDEIFREGIEEPYLMEVEARGRTGDHLHPLEGKVEVFCPLNGGYLRVGLKHRETKVEKTVELKNERGRNIDVFIIPPGVAHAVKGAPLISSNYLVLSNQKEKDALKEGGVIDFPLGDF